jgi:hypothetical protein
MLFRKRQLGVSLLEVGLALAVSAMGMMWVFQQQDQKLQDIKVELAATKIKSIANASDLYILANTDKLADLLADEPVIVIPAGHWNSIFEPASNVDMPSLQKAKFIPENVYDVNIWHQHHALLLKKTSDTTMEALLFTYGGEPIQDGNIGRVAVKMGINGGFLSTNLIPGVLPTTIQGVAGGWSSNTQEWTPRNTDLFLIKPGHLVYNLGKYNFALKNNITLPDGVSDIPTVDMTPPTGNVDDATIMKNLLLQEQELKDDLAKLKELNKVDQCATFGFCNP